jgi:hypothetical protein
MATMSKLTVIAAAVASSVCASPGTSRATTYSTAFNWYGVDPDCWTISSDGGNQNTCSTTQVGYLAPVTDAAGLLTAEIYVQNPSSSETVECEIAGTYCNSEAPEYTAMKGAPGSGDQTISFTGVIVPCAAYVYCTVPPNGWVWGYQFE